MLSVQVRDGEASIRDQNALLLPDNIYEGKKLRALEKCYCIL